MTPRSSRFIRAVRSAALLALAIGVARPALAEEGGSGHYMPGSLASFIDGAPTERGFMIRVDGINYEGDVSLSQALPIAGENTLGVKAESWGAAFTAVWTPEFNFLSNFTYSMAASVPYVFMKVRGSLLVQQGDDSEYVTTSSKVDGIGDMMLVPVLLNYNANPDLNVHARLTVYPPTGKYQTGRLANTGKNYWTYEPTLGISYFGQQSLTEAQVYMGLDFNSANDATDYKSGRQLHVEGTLAQHFPSINGLVGIGVTSYYYKQISGDSGAGATLGSFKSKAAGVGPVASYMADFGDQSLAVEFKWVIDVDTTRRLNGHTAFLKVLFDY